MPDRPRMILDANRCGIAWMLVASMLFVIVDSLIKEAGSTLNPFEVAFFRNLFAFAALLPILAKRSFKPLRTNKIELHVFRGFLGAVGTWALFFALTMSPLAKVTALSFTTPVFGVILAVFILSERMTTTRWLVLAFGAAGAALVMKPTGQIDVGGMLVLLAAFIQGFIAITIKMLSRTESSLTIVAWMSITIGFFSLGPAIFFWQWPTTREFVVLVFLGLSGASAQYCMARALEVGDTVVVLPIEYFKLIWAALVGYWVFAEMVDPWTVLGGGMIVVAGIINVCGISFLEEFSATRRTANTEPKGRCQ